MATLLLISQVEPNPGPQTRTGTEFESILKDIHDKLSKMDSLDEKLDKVCSDMDNIKAWQSHIDEQIQTLNQENQRLNNSIMKLTEQNKQLTETNQAMQTRLIDYEARGRRNNLIFRGVEKAKDRESWQDSERKVKALIRDKLDLNTDTIEIQRAHRLGANAIIVNFLKFKDREVIFKRKKNAGWFGCTSRGRFPSGDQGNKAEADESNRR